MLIYGKIVTDRGMGRYFRQKILKLKDTKLVNTEMETSTKNPEIAVTEVVGVLKDGTEPAQEAALDALCC